MLCRVSPLLALVSFSAVLCLNPTPGNAAIVLLDFEDLRTVSADPTIIVGQVYIHDGVRLTALPAPPPAEPTTRLEYAGTLSSSFAGSTMLRQGVDSAEIVLDLVNGRPFTLLFLQLAELPNFDALTGKPIGSGTFPVTFTGVRANGTTITETVDVDRFPTIDSFIFPGFVGLTSVHWFQGPGGFLPGFGDHQFDNILVLVPGPATFWLLGLGALVVMFGRGSRARQTGRGWVRSRPRSWSTRTGNLPQRAYARARAAAASIQSAGTATRRSAKLAGRSSAWLAS
jgi:hypothetical protein